MLVNQRVTPFPLMINGLRRPATHQPEHCAPTRVFGTHVATQCPHAIHVLPSIIDFQFQCILRYGEIASGIWSYIIDQWCLEWREGFVEHIKNFPNALWRTWKHCLFSFRFLLRIRKLERLKHYILIWHQTRQLSDFRRNPKYSYCNPQCVF